MLRAGPAEDPDGSRAVRIGLPRRATGPLTAGWRPGRGIVVQRPDRYRRVRLWRAEPRSLRDGQPVPGRATSRRTRAGTGPMNAASAFRRNRTAILRAGRSGDPAPDRSHRCGPDGALHPGRTACSATPHGRDLCHRIQAVPPRRARGGRAGPVFERPAAPNRRGRAMHPVCNHPRAGGRINPRSAG